jgi:hypothetical protein
MVVVDMMSPVAVLVHTQVYSSFRLQEEMATVVMAAKKKAVVFMVLIGLMIDLVERKESKHTRPSRPGVLAKTY